MDRIKKFGDVVSAGPNNRVTEPKTVDGDSFEQPGILKQAAAWLASFLKPTGNPGEFEEGQRRLEQDSAAAQRSSSEPSTEAAALSDGTRTPPPEPDMKAFNSFFVTGAKEIMKQHVVEFVGLMAKQQEELRQIVANSSGRSFSIDRMLNELTDKNRPEAVQAALNTKDWGDGANLYRLLLEHEVRTGAKPDPVVHAAARNWLIQYIAKNRNLLQGDVLYLDSDFYRIYQMLAPEQIASGEKATLESAIPFIRPELANTQGAVVALAHTLLEESVVPGIMKPAYKLWDLDHNSALKGLKPFTLTPDSNAFRALVIENPNLNPKTEQDYLRLTIPLAYLTTVENLDGIPNARAFIRGIQSMDDAVKRRNPQFLSVLRVFEYREKMTSLSGKDYFLGGSVSLKEVNQRLQNIKDEYFKSKFPYLGTQQVSERVGTNSLMNLRAGQDFDEQMRAAGKDWKLADIVKLAETEGLPDSFLNRFQDHGVALYRDHVFPALLKKYGGDSAASAQALQGLLLKNEPKASLQRQAEFWRDTVKFMAEDLKRSAIRTDQVEKMLKEMTEVSEKAVTIIQAAGAGKSTMARYLAKVLLRDVPFILFVSPFNEPRANMRKLASLDELANALPQNGKPVEFYVMAEEYAALLNKASSKEVRALGLGLHILDEFDADDYSQDQPKSVQEILATQGVTRVVNMSASDDDLRLLNKQERLQQKLADATREKKPGWEAKTAKLQADIAEIQKNIELEFQRSIKIEDMALSPEALAQGEGKSILVLHPNERDADKLAGEYLAQLQPGNVLLYRNNRGERRAYIQGQGEQSYESFAKGFDKMQPKPALFCLYTKDSRGGDFERFSNRDMVVHQHIIYEKTPNRNTLYQNLRRLRGNLRDIPVTLHLAEPMALGAFFEQANALQKAESRRQETLRLTTKIQRKTAQYVKAALESKWKQISDSKLGAFWKREHYDQAVREAMAGVVFENTDPEKQYQEIQQRVTERFLKLVNAEYTQSQTQSDADQLAFLERLRRDGTGKIWAARPPELKGRTVGDVWAAYLGMTKEKAKKTLGGFPRTTVRFDSVIARDMSGDLMPGLMSDSIPDITELTTQIVAQRTKIAEAQRRVDAMKELQKIAAEQTASTQMPQAVQTALADVQFYQDMLTRTTHA